MDSSKRSGTMSMNAYKGKKTINNERGDSYGNHSDLIEMRGDQSTGTTTTNAGHDDGYHDYPMNQIVVRSTVQVV